jgi:hypothetical protein
MFGQDKRALLLELRRVHPPIESLPHCKEPWGDSKQRVRSGKSINRSNPGGQDDYSPFERGITVPMPTPPPFFLPFLPPELAEDAYAHMAEKCEKIAPDPRGRVYSVSFVHEGVVWVATVGKHLKGHRRGHRTTARLIKDPAMVLAIFPGTPYTIVTDALHTTGSNFQNIFFGTPLEVEYFSVPPST